MKTVRIKYKDPKETDKTKEIREQKKYFASISRIHRQPKPPTKEDIQEQYRKADEEDWESGETNYVP